MKTYTVLFAQDVPHYGTAGIEAADDNVAIAAAKELDPAEYTHDPAWDDPVCRRIVHIEAPDGRIIAQDIALDEFFLRHAQNIDPCLCDAASALKAALERIAAIPLWGEPIADEALKSELTAVVEYDRALDQFEPSCDTESSYLRDAVETAREALAALNPSAAALRPSPTRL
jgi:hypothetical protein